MCDCSVGVRNVHRFGRGVDENFGESWHGVDDCVFDVVGELVGGDDVEVAGYEDFGFGVKAVADPAHVKLLDGDDPRYCGAGGASVGNELGIDCVHEALPDASYGAAHH